VNRFVLRPRPFVDVSDRPSFLPTVPDRNPRTLWARQEVAFISSASVAPFGRFNLSVLVPFRGPDSYLAALAAFAPLLAFLARWPSSPTSPCPAQHGACVARCGAFWWLPAPE